MEEKKEGAVPKNLLAKKTADLEEQRAAKIERSLGASIKEGALNMASNSIFTTFLVPLALSLKASNLQIGLMNAAQQVASTAGQIPGARLTARMDRKAIWLLCQLIAKVAIWIPIVMLPFMSLHDPITYLVLFASISSFFLALRGPAWASLMGDLVPLEKRGTYFGKRNMITGIAGVLITLIGGFVIAAYGFSVIFLVGLLLSVASIPIFWKMFEPSARKIYHYKHVFAFRPKDWPLAIKLNMKLVIFTVYLTFFYFAVEIASPYYTVFMLNNLSISYEVFGMLTIVGALSRILSFRYWGFFNDKFGSHKILLVTGVLACFTPLGWLLVSNSWEILLLKIFDGFIWAGFDQVAFNYLLDITPAEKRSQYVANHNFFTGIGIIGGALLGSFLSEAVMNSHFLWFAGLQLVFLSSFILRMIAAVLLLKIREIGVSQTDILPVRYVFWQTLAVEPATGLKNAVNFTFRSAFDRDAAYVKAIKKRKMEEARLQAKKEIIEGTKSSLGQMEKNDNKKT